MKDATDIQSIGNVGQSAVLASNIGSNNKITFNADPMTIKLLFDVLGKVLEQNNMLLGIIQSNSNIVGDFAPQSAIVIEPDLDVIRGKILPFQR